jgi:hypothetical protein
MKSPVETEIDQVVQQIEELKQAGDPDGRTSDLNEYLRVLYLRLKMELQAGARPWEQE